MRTSVHGITGCVTIAVLVACAGARRDASSVARSSSPPPARGADAAPGARVPPAGSPDRAAALVNPLEQQVGHGDPVDVGRELDLARAAHAGGRSDEEARHLERAVMADRGAFDARIRLAELLLQRGDDLRRAGRLLGEAGAIRPDDVRVDRLHGALDELQGDDEHAAMRYRRVLAVDPDPELRLRRAVLLHRMKADDEALEELRRVSSERQKDRAARVIMAEIYEARGRLLDAESMLSEVVRLAPTEPAPLRRLAAFYRRTGRPARAHEAEEHARSLEGGPRLLRPLRPSRY